MKTLKINEQYITFQNPGTRILAIKSPKGSGKTRWLQDNLSEGSALFLTHRIALGRDIAIRNGAAFYKDGPSTYGSSRLVVCIDSLAALLENDAHNGAVVVIDEATQLLRHFIGETCNNFRRAIYWALANKLYHCKQLVLLDADLNQETLDFFTELVKGERDHEPEITWVENNWNPKDKTFKEFPSCESLQLELINAVQGGLNCFIACDTRSQVDVIEALIKDKAKGFLAVTSDTSANKEQAAFIADVNNVQKNYQVVAASPSLSTGIDINQPWFDKVFLFGNAYKATAGDLLQASARVRTVKEINFWVNPTVRYEEDNWEEILKSKLKINFGTMHLKAKSIDLWAIDYDPASGEVSISDKLYVEMFCKITALENQSLNDLNSTFTEKASHEGRVIKIKLTNAQEEASDRAKQISKELKKAIKEQKQAAILNASDISDLEFTVLSASPEELSTEEHLAVKKRKLLDLVGGMEDLLPLAVEKEGELYKAVYLQSLLSRNEEELVEQDTKDKYKLPTDRKHRIKTRELIKDFLNLINYEAGLNGEYLNFNKCPWLCGNVGGWFSDRNVEFIELLGLKVPSDVNSKPMQFIQTVLNKLGVKAEAKQRRVNGERVREYYLDLSSVETMNKILEARELMFKKQQEEEAELVTGPF